MKRRYSKTFFENPYLKDSERRLSSTVIMDEARQKWRSSYWRAKPEDFDIDRDDLAEQEGQTTAEEAAEKASETPERFQLDVRDLTGGTISLASLRQLTYSPAYRPKGSLEEISEHKVAPMSTLSRYDVLAGQLEAPPEDLSFLSDAQHRLARDRAKGEQRDGRLRMDSRRLETSVDERRSKLMSLLPAEDDSHLEEIITESKRRRLKEDIELGRVRLDADGKPKMRRKRHRLQYNHNDPMDAYYARTDGSRLDRLPEQTGMTDKTQALPEFESETRRWSEIEGLNPTWSQIAEHTERRLPEDQEGRALHEPRYIHDDLYNSNRPYRPVAGRAPRMRVRSEEAGQFNNEYLRDTGIKSDRVREILKKEYRGRWIPPEFFRDDELVNQWFNQYNRGALSGEDFVHWAYRQRTMAEQQRQAQAMAQQNARRQQEEAMHREQQRRRAERNAAMRQEREERRRYESARQQGYRQGEAMRRREEEERERAYRERYEREQYEREQYERGYLPEYDYYEQGYGQYPQGYGYPPEYDPRYQGMYPDLFDDE